MTAVARTETAAYVLNVKTFGRSGGGSAVSAAAYRAGERIRDAHSGRTYDHTERRDVLYTEIVLPSRFADSDMGWARDRSSLWNAAEEAEWRKNARVAREYLVTLPAELTAAQRLGLVRGFSQELSDRYRFALDLSVHAARDVPGGAPGTFHAHLLATTREVGQESLAAKTTLELSDSKRGDLGLQPAIDELLFVRERWASITNEALREAHMRARVLIVAAEPRTVEEVRGQAREAWLRLRIADADTPASERERRHDDHLSR